MELLEERKNARIYRSSPWHIYELKFPDLNKDEKEFVELFSRALLKKYSARELEILFIKDKEEEAFVNRIYELLSQIGDTSIQKLSDEKEEEIRQKISRFVKQNISNLEHPYELSDLLFHEIVGLSRIDYLLEDDTLEEIMINSHKKPVFVYDKKYGLCKTNILFDSAEELLALVERIASYVNKDLNKDKPLLDARLPDGSRVNATIAPASPMGATLTIRKFGRSSLSITQLIKNKTISPVAAAFLWMAVEGLSICPLNMLIAGGTSSGKTTTLNALTVFIPEKERIISIEDTLELNLHDRENWVQLEARYGPYEKELSLNDLLKNALRMRADRIIVGEVRGEEAETMFTAMDIGQQGMMGTMHANSAKEAIIRLQSPPMAVPKAMFSLLDLIVMQHRMKLPGQGVVRRLTEICEVSLMDEQVLLNNLFSFDRQDFSLKRTSIPSQSVEKWATLTGKTKADISKEISNRARLLNSMAEKAIFDYPAIRKVINAYLSDPSSVSDLNPS